MAIEPETDTTRPSDLGTADAGCLRAAGDRYERRQRRLGALGQHEPRGAAAAVVAEPLSGAHARRGRVGPVLRRDRFRAHRRCVRGVPPRRARLSRRRGRLVRQVPRRAPRNRSTRSTGASTRPSGPDPVLCRVEHRRSAEWRASDTAAQCDSPSALRRNRRPIGAHVVAGRTFEDAARRLPRVAAALPVVGRRHLRRSRRPRQQSQPPP